jgi:hypothetical protein
MKIIGVSILLIAMLSGCGSLPKGQLDLISYIEKNKPLVERGDMKHSVYFAGLYERQILAGAPSHYLAMSSEMLKAAQRMEAGEITKDEFANFRRESYVVFAVKDEQYKAAAYQRYQAEQQQATANMIQTLSLMNSMQPQAIQATGGAPLRMQNVQGNFRYCTYNNNVVVTVRLPGSCPAYQ